MKTLGKWLVSGVLTVFFPLVLLAILVAAVHSALWERNVSSPDYSRDHG